MGIILSLAIFLFFIIYFSVRLAISPLLNRHDKIIEDKQDFGLVKLRDIELLSDTELKEVMELYQNKSDREKNYEVYKKYAKVLNELKEMGYLADEQYSIRLNKLNKYFNVD
jgi:hypothetical protein